MRNRFRPLVVSLVIAAVQATTAASLAHAQTGPGWYFTGTDNGPGIAYADASGEALTLTCGQASPMMGSVHLVPMLSDALKQDWNAGDRTIHMALESTARESRALKMTTAFYPGDTRDIRLNAARVPDLTETDPAAALTFRGDAYNGELLGTIPVSGLQAPLTEALRVCNAYPASPGAPSFNCIASLLSRFGEREICADPQAADLDGRVLARYLGVTKTRAPAARAEAWARYLRWTEDRLACGRDMACVIATGTAYLDDLGTAAPPEQPAPQASAALDPLRSPQGLRDEAARHGIPSPTLHAIVGRTAYVTPGCDYGCAANVYAIHDIGPDETVPLDPAADLAALAEIGPLYGSSIKINHLRLGHALPPRDAEGGLPAILRANAMFDPQGRARWTVLPDPRTWAQETDDRQAAGRFVAQRADAADRDRQARLEAHFARETVRHARLTAAGHVYRAPDYWVDFFYPETIRGLFEGQRLDPGATALRQSVAGFVIGFNRHCGAFLPADAVPFTETRVTRILNGYGVEISRANASRSLRVHKELAPFFADMAQGGPTSTEVGSALGTLDDLMSGRFDAQDLIARTAGHALDAQRIVASNDCRGPSVAQFLANLSANANGMPVPITEGIAIPGATDETDPAPSPDRATGLADACMRATGYASESAPRCACVAAEVASLLDRAGRDAALADFRPVADALFLGGSQADTPAGRAYQACVQRTAR